MNRLRVAIVGATGVVGETLARILAERRFPMGSLRAFATKRSAGARVRSGDHEALVEVIGSAALSLIAARWWSTNPRCTD